MFFCRKIFYFLFRKADCCLSGSVCLLKNGKNECGFEKKIYCIVILLNLNFKTAWKKRFRCDILP